jgi:tetratricopeptide (TPR) repeat protein
MTHHSMGRTYLAIGDYKKALVNLETSISLYQQLELDPFGQWILLDIGRVYLYANNPQKVVEYFERCLFVIPPSSPSYQAIQRSIAQIRSAQR